MVFEKGHPPYYTGGAKPGHAPTNPNGHLPGLVQHGRRVGAAWGFDQPLGAENRRKGGRQAKNKERLCMEAIQNQDETRSLAARTKSLEQRFPPGMVRRLLALHAVAQDPSHRDFLHAQRLVREILTTLRKQPDEDGTDASAPTSADAIVVVHGRIDVPMPGAAEQPPAPTEGGGGDARVPIGGGGVGRP